MSNEQKQHQAIVSILDSYGIIRKAGAIADEIISDISEMKIIKTSSDIFESQVKATLSRFFNDPQFGINEAYAEISKLLTPSQSYQAGAFAEWCSRNGWKLMNGESIFVPLNCWYNYEAFQDGEGIEQWFTTDELFEIFQNAEPK